MLTSPVFMYLVTERFFQLTSVLYYCISVIMVAKYNKIVRFLF